MDVVLAISNVKTQAKTDKPYDDITMVSVSLRDPFKMWAPNSPRSNVQEVNVDLTFKKLCGANLQDSESKIKSFQSCKKLLKIQVVKLFSKKYRN